MQRRKKAQEKTNATQQAAGWKCTVKRRTVVKIGPLHGVNLVEKGVLAFSERSALAQANAPRPRKGRLTQF